MTNCPTGCRRLAEVMDVCRDPAVDREFVINIEIKSAPGDPDYDAEHQVSAAVAGLVLGWGIGEAGGDVIVSSFDMEAINRIRAIDPAIPTAYLTFEVLAPDLLVGRVAAAGHTAIHPPRGLNRPGPGGHRPRRRPRGQRLDGQRPRTNRPPRRTRRRRSDHRRP